MEGEAPGPFRYSFSYDFGGSGGDKKGRINSAWLQYDGLSPVLVRAGAFAPSQGLEGSASQSLFAERASPSAVVRNLSGGDGPKAFAVFANGRRWNAVAAVTGEALDSENHRQQRALFGRLGFVAIERGDLLVHVGASSTAVLRTAAGDAGAGRIRLRDRPENRVNALRLVDTGPITARGAAALGVEAAVQRRRFAAHAEYFRIGVQPYGASRQPSSFDGWYVQGAWTIAGRPRRYRVAGATFDSPIPKRDFDPLKGRWGSWEVGVRYSRLGLNYLPAERAGQELQSAILGGEQRIASLGLNWYPMRELRFQAAIQDVSVERFSPSGAEVGRRLQIFSLRTQLAY